MKTQKYKPQQLSDVIFPNAAVEARINAFANGELRGNILLHGPNGTGKTTIANLLPTLISVDPPHIEPKTADELINLKDLDMYMRTTASFSRMYNTNQYYWVFNEFDTVKGNIAKLWNVMDEFQEYMCVIITTNDPMNIHKSIRSRCMDIHMPAITPAAMLPRADLMLQSEGIFLPYAQLLNYLNTKAMNSDIRKYNQLVDELILLRDNGKAMPQWSESVTKIRVV